MKAYVVCCNDSIELVVVDEDETLANSKKEKLAEEHFKRNKWNYKDYEEYRNRCYWHLHEVSVLIPKTK